MDRSASPWSSPPHSSCHWERTDPQVDHLAAFTLIMGSLLRTGLQLYSWAKAWFTYNPSLSVFPHTASSALGSRDSAPVFSHILLVGPAPGKFQGWRQMPAPLRSSLPTPPSQWRGGYQKEERKESSFLSSGRKDWVRKGVEVKTGMTSVLVTCFCKINCPKI